jgi:hypothetical protein
MVVTFETMMDLKTTFKANWQSCPMHLDDQGEVCSGVVERVSSLLLNYIYSLGRSNIGKWAFENP